MNIQIQALSKTYNGNKQALREIDLSIGSGMFGLLGPNGASKSTLMQILATLIPPTGGKVQVGPYVLGKDDHWIRQCLGYLPQASRFYDKLTGEEFLHYVAAIKGMKSAKERSAAVATLLEKVNLQHHAKRKLKTYSGGMKQRIGIAQALIGDPRVLIVDEPTAGLDPEERIRFRELLEELGQERIIVLSTHIVADIEASCRSLAILDQGSMRYHGTMADLLAKVQGRVWTTYVHERDLHRLTGESVIRRRKTIEGYELRMISSTCPLPDAVPASPSLEDAYLYLTRGESDE